MHSKDIEEIRVKKFDAKLQKRYGIPKEELKDLSLSKIRSLSNVNKTALKETRNFKIFRGIGSTLVKGASLGAGVSGTINTIFPNIVPVVSSALTTSSDLPVIGKTLSYALAASKPIDLVSGYIIIGIGAGIGAILYGSYSLVKYRTKNIMIYHDRKKARKLCRKNMITL